MKIHLFDCRQFIKIFWTEEKKYIYWELTKFRKVLKIQPPTPSVLLNSRDNPRYIFIVFLMSSSNPTCDLHGWSLIAGG